MDFRGAKGDICWTGYSAGADKTGYRDPYTHWAVRNQGLATPAIHLNRGDPHMLRGLLSVALLAALAAGWATSASADPRAYGQSWGGADSRDWNRFYHYPYVYYPQNFYGQDYWQSSDSMYYRYRPEMRIPVYNKKWFNYYPEHRRFHYGHHFNLDVF